MHLTLTQSPRSLRWFGWWLTLSLLLSSIVAATAHPIPMPPSSHALEREPIAPAAAPEGVPAADSAATPDVDAVAAGADAGWWAQVQADIAASEYQPSLQRVGADQVWQASNRAQGFRTTFGAEGVTLLPRSSDGAIAWE